MNIENKKNEIQELSEEELAKVSGGHVTNENPDTYRNNINSYTDMLNDIASKQTSADSEDNCPDGYSFDSFSNQCEPDYSGNSHLR